MVNILLLGSEEDSEDVEHNKAWSYHDLVVQEQTEDKEGMYKILKCRTATKRTEANWPDVSKLIRKLEKETKEEPGAEPAEAL